MQTSRSLAHTCRYRRERQTFCRMCERVCRKDERAGRCASEVVAAKAMVEQREGVASSAIRASRCVMRLP